jgi:8-oxo-dGTP pyrophosphatase MutT (NUDIX family)
MRSARDFLRSAVSTYRNDVVLERDLTSLIQALPRALAEELPGVDAQLQMAPGHRMNRQMADVSEKPCREAAVLALLHPDEAGASLVLTVRPAHMATHAGQVAFPGGRIEAGETFVDAALREAHEEIALDPTLVSVAGMLTPLYIPPSNFCVYPVVGTTDQRPSLYPADGEVDAILHVPLDLFLNPVHRTIVARRVHGLEISAPCFSFPPYEIWGATAMMLSELSAVLNRINCSDY